MQVVTSRQSSVVSQVCSLRTWFAASLQQLLCPSLKTEDWRLETPLAIALSGGADSLALALLTQQWARAHGAHIITFTVDHGLRTESAAEAQQVAAWMHARGIAHHILTPPHQPDIRNAQASARKRRYSALAEACAEHGCTHLLLGHHADDQAETVTLQQHRGDTPPSRAGMPAVRMQGTLALLRPLLGVRKQSLIDYLRAQHQEWVEDPSNQSDRYARNRLRKHLSEEQTLTLWHEAQRAGEQRHADEQTRNGWMLVHSRTTPTTATLDRAAWGALLPERSMDYLSHAIRVIGGKPFRPRSHETMRLHAHITASAEGAATLGLCRIRWNAQEITLTPEHPSVTALDDAPLTPHIEENILVSEPFWWFSSPLYVREI